MAEHEHQAEKQTNGRRRTMIAVLMAIVAVGVIVGGLYWYVSGQTVYIDQSIIQAPIINLSPANSGVLQAVFVKAGRYSGG